MAGSTSIVTTDNRNEQSPVNNTTQVLDAGAIQSAYQYASKVADNTSNNIGAVLGTVDSIAGKAIATAADNSAKTVAALQSGLSNATGSITDAYTRAQSGGINTQQLLLGLAGLAVLALLISRK